MRLVDLVGGAAPVLAVVALVLVATKRRLVRGLRRLGATDAAHAAPWPVRSPVDRYWLGRLGASGVLHEVAPAQYWLDEPAWEREHERRRRRALLVVATLLAALVLLAAVGRLR